MDNTIIRVDSLRKAFKVSKRPRGFLGHVANLFVPMYETRTAVNGISFAINQGEAVGLIGSNEIVLQDLVDNDETGLERELVGARTDQRRDHQHEQPG